MAEDVQLDELRLAALGRREVVPGIVGLTSVVAVLVFLAIDFVPVGDARPFRIWLVATAVVVVTIFAVLAIVLVRQPGDREAVRRWLPLGRGLRTLLNLAVIASPWILLPDAEPALRAVLLMLYLWFLATEVMVTVDPHGLVWLGLAGLPTSLAAYLLMSHARYALPLSLFLAMASVSLFVVHRQIGRAASDSLDRRLATPPVLRASTAVASQGGLTRRQIEVLHLLSAGLSNKEIARSLGVAPATIKTHVAQTLAVLGAANRTEAAAKARLLGLFS